VLESYPAAAAAATLASSQPDTQAVAQFTLAKRIVFLLSVGLCHHIILPDSLRY